MKKIVAVLTLLFLIVGCSNNTSNNKMNELKTEQTENTQQNRSYTIVTTGQENSYDPDGNVIQVSEGDPLYGQDANYESAAFSFTDNGDGTVTDNNTGLMWQAVPINGKMSWKEALEYVESLELAGYDDWRLPTVKELFSISDFSTGWPYINEEFFAFAEESDDMPPTGGDGGPNGGAPQGEKPQEIGEKNSDNVQETTPPPINSEQEEFGISKSQGQFWSSNFYYVGKTHGDANTAFGVNHTTGHIKGYPSDTSGPMGKYVRAVRGDVYGENQFVDNGDGTVTDEATGLMWMKTDAKMAMNWADALAYAESFEYAGYSDWRLPDVKELQSIVDYSGTYPAINQDFFEITQLEQNENYYFWTSTSAYFSPKNPGYGYAWYVAFGYAVDNEGNDTHGAGAVRFSPKYEGSSYDGEGGDNILNSVRLVRNVGE